MALLFYNLLSESLVSHHHHQSFTLSTKLHFLLKSSDLAYYIDKGLGTLCGVCVLVVRCTTDELFYHPTIVLVASSPFF